MHMAILWWLCAVAVWSMVMVQGQQIVAQGSTLAANVYNSAIFSYIFVDSNTGAYAIDTAL
jgi:hypothetical protein